MADCSSPRASWWFTGAGAAIDHESTLVLSNVDAGQSVVDVRVLSPEGEADVAESGGQGVKVPAGGQVALPLANLTPQNGRARHLGARHPGPGRRGHHGPLRRVAHRRVRL